MARADQPAHVASTAGTTADYLMQLRFDETLSTSGLIDVIGAGARSMTVLNGTPGVFPAAMQNNTTSGARSYDGATQAHSRSTVDGDQGIFQASNGGWGIACWVRPTSLAANGTIIELGEWSSPETEVTNVQMNLQAITDGSFRMNWEHDVGTSRNNGSGSGRLVVGVWSHVGVRMQPDPDNIGQMQIDFFHNGVNVARAKNRPWPTGGSSSRWIVGASREQGTAVGTYGNFYAGAIDDLIITKFPPDVAWFRKLYSDGVRDFQIKRDGTSVAEDSDRRQWATYTRVLVKTPIVDPAATSPTYSFDFLSKTDIDWINLTKIDDNDFVESVSWSDSVDDFISTARARLFRNFYLYNASPFSVTSTFKDNPFVDSTTGEHLLRSMRAVRIETAIVPFGMSSDDAGPYWEVMFDGFIRAVDVSDDFVEVTIGDLGVALMDVFIEPNKDGTDRSYGSVGGSAIEGQLQQIIDDNDPARYDLLVASTAALGSPIVLTLLSTTAVSTDVNGRGKPHHFNVGDTLVVSGTTNFNTPTGTVDTITSVTSTTITLTRVSTAAWATENNVGQIRGIEARSYAGGKPTLWTPISSAWTVYQWNEPASKNVLQSLDEIATQIGWRVRFRWDDLRQQFRLAMFNPASSSSVFRGDFGFSPLGVLSIQRLSTKVDDTRNTWVVEYTDNANKDPRANRKIYVVSAVDKTSIRTYGRRFARVRVASDSLINRSTEAQSMADTALRDLSVPIAECEVETLFDRRAQSQDKISLTEEELVSGYQIASFFGRLVSGACVSVSHSISRSSSRTTMTLRKVTDDASYVGAVARVDRYDDIISQTGAVPGRGLSPPASALAPTVQNLGALNAIRTVRVSWSVPGGDLNRNYLETEVHQSTTNGFTPSSSTLAVVVRGTNAIVTGMTVGTTYYVKVVHCDRMGNRSADSPQTAYVS
jgi:hypothetical protein